MTAALARAPAPAIGRVRLAWGRAADVPAGDEWLSPAERTVAAALRWPKRRSDWRLGRWVAKRAVIACVAAEQGAVEPSDVEILARADGAPVAWMLGGAPAAGVSASISHSDGVGFAAAVAGDTALGCDVERIRPRSGRFVEDYFTAAEREQVARAPADDRPAVATLIWSAKEAALKVLREGLRLDTRSVAVECPGAWSPAWGRRAGFRVRVRDGRHVEGCCWVADGFVWTVAGYGGALLSRDPATGDVP